LPKFGHGVDENFQPAAQEHPTQGALPDLKLLVVAPVVTRVASALAGAKTAMHSRCDLCPVFPKQPTLRRALCSSARGQSRRFDVRPITSGPPQSTDIVRPAGLVRFVPLASTLNSTAAPIALHPPCGPPAPALSKSSSPRCVPTPRRRSFDWGFSSVPAQTPRPRTPGCRSPADCGV
jgi:hypothetical protein